MIWQLSRLSERQTEQSALGDNSVLATAITEMREIYTSDVVNRLIPAGVKVTHDFERHKGQSLFQ